MSAESNWKSSWIVRNLANFITSVGLFMSVVLLWEVVFHREWIVAIFLSVSFVLITDFLDGWVARRLNIISKLGAAMDRLRDKIFQLTMFSFFLLDPRVDLWLKIPAYPLIMIEILLLSIWFLGVKKNLNVSAGKWGKAKMFLVSAGILACPAIIIAQEHGMKVPHFVTPTLFLILLISLGLGIMSFKTHVAKYCEQLQ